MSHFITLVFNKENGKTVEQLLAPFDENNVYDAYVQYTKEQAIKEVRKEIDEYKNGLYAKYLENPKEYEENCHNKGHIEYLKNEFPKRLDWTDEECYEYMKKYYSEDMIKKNGDLLSTYNPKSKWDWYSIGGRWDKYLRTLDGKQVNRAYVSEVDWEDTIPFAFITPNGKWHETGKMGWWAMVSDEKENSDWETEFKEFVDKLDGDTMVTVIDCHI